MYRKTGSVGAGILNIDKNGFFTWREMLKSDEHPDLGYGDPRSIPVQHREAIRWLVILLLLPIRAFWGLPVRVLSGYRSKRLNAIVGGSEGSQHMRGEAADIRPVIDNASMTAFERAAFSDALCDELWQFLRDNMSWLFGQAILYRTDGPGGDWVHISLAMEHKRGEAFVKRI